MIKKLFEDIDSSKDKILILISFSESQPEDFNLDVFSRAYFISDEEEQTTESEIEYFQARSPGDLTYMVMKCSEILQENPDSDIYYVFDSLTKVIQYTYVRKIYRFINVFLNRLRSKNCKKACFVLGNNESEKQFKC